MGDLVVMDVVGSGLEAVLVCAILRDAGIQCMHRVTNVGSGRMDGLMFGGPREIVVHPDQLRRARRVIRDHRDGPRPPAGGGRSERVRTPLAPAFANRSIETPDESLAGSVLAAR
jgi:hypothetical protein